MRKSLMMLVLLAIVGCSMTERKGFVMEHTAIDVADPAAVADWWVKNLGFEITMQKEDTTHTTFIVDKTGKIAVELYRAPDGTTPPDYKAMRPLQLHRKFRARSPLPSGRSSWRA